MKSTLLVLFFCGAGCFSFAGNESKKDSLKAGSQDSLFIRRFRNHPHVTFEFARRSDRFDLQSPINDTLVIRYEPNTKVNVVGTLDYRWLSVSIGLLSLHPIDGKKKGNSSQFSLRASFNGRRIWNSNFLQVTQGFYQVNPKVSDPTWNSATDAYPLRPDMTSFTLFSNLLFCFKPERFSYRAALWQLERQERSAGSFIAGLSYRLSILASDTSQTLIPVSLYSQFAPEFRTVAIQQSNLSFHGGYIHSFVNKYHWFLTLYFLPGISVENGFYLPEDLLIRNYRSKISLASEFRFIVGYNGDNWYSGLSAHSLSFTASRQVGMLVDNSFNYIRLFVGYRFKEVDRSKGSKLLRRIGL